MFAKTDLVPNPPEGKGDGWILKGNNFFTGLVCSKCGGVRPNKTETYICKRCGASFSCFSEKAVLFNTWEKPITVRVGTSRWGKPITREYMDYAETYGPWKEIEECKGAE